MKMKELFFVKKGLIHYFHQNYAMKAQIKLIFNFTRSFFSVLFFGNSFPGPSLHFVRRDLSYNHVLVSVLGI